MTTISAGTTSTTAYVATPDTTGTLVLKTGASDTTALTLDASQNATFAGSIPSVGGYPSYQCRAWVKFVGSTGAITASGNVSGVVRNTAGIYTITFATPMPDANYAVNVTAANIAGTGQTVGQSTTTAPTASAVVVYCATNGVGAADPASSGSMFVTIHR